MTRRAFKYMLVTPYAKSLFWSSILSIYHSLHSIHKRQEMVKRISGYQTKEPTQSTKMRRVLTNRLLFKDLFLFAPLSDCPIPPFSQTPKYVHLFRWSFARALQCAAIPKIQVDTVRQLLCIQIWDVWSMKGGKWKVFDLYSRIIIRF